jgi:uncharacterized caspase-like protein
MDIASVILSSLQFAFGTAGCIAGGSNIVSTWIALKNTRMNPKPAEPRFQTLRRAVLAVLLALVAAWIPATSAQAKRLALVIGNDSYRAVAGLANARNDARLMADLLRAAGFEVVEKNDLDRGGFLDEVEVLQKRLAKGDEVVFYFAGHGVQIGNDAVLLPVDIKATSSGRVRQDGVPLFDVQEALKDARVSLLIIDACRDNPFLREGKRGVGDDRGLAVPPDLSSGQAIIMSASRGQRALDKVPGDAAAHNGLFTHEFVAVMRQPGLDLTRGLKLVQERVKDLAAKANHEQRPGLHDELSGSFFFFQPRGPQALTRPAETVQSAATPGATGGISLDDLEREDKVRREWAQWQTRMQADFDRVAALKIGADLRVTAWERFLSTWSQDNP